MRIIDLTLPLFHHMPVFPGDPEVEIVEIHKLNVEGWRLRKVNITTHIGTHVNFPFHMLYTGKTLSDYPIESFFADSKIYNDRVHYGHENGLIFNDINISKDIADKLVQKKPKFVGLSANFEMDIEVEKYLLENDVLSFENLANTDELPSKFKFFGIPLNIEKADGSPVRAFAQC